MRVTSGFVFLALCMSTVSSAQMGGGMMGGSGSNGGYRGMMGGLMGGSLSGMMGGGSGLTIGPDGTLYITRSGGNQNQGQSSAVDTQLSAIDANGDAKWTLSINSSSASQPVLGKDGMLFLTTSDWLSWMYNWMSNWFSSGSLPSPGAAPKLLIVEPGATSATIVHSITLAGQMASAPQLAPDNAGGYTVYVITVEGLTKNGFDNSASSGSYLYAFSHNGTQKYRLQLSKGGAGMMGL